MCHFYSWRASGSEFLNIKEIQSSRHVVTEWPDYIIVSFPGEPASHAADDLFFYFGLTCGVLNFRLFPLLMERRLLMTHTPGARRAGVVPCPWHLEHHCNLGRTPRNPHVCATSRPSIPPIFAVVRVLCIPTASCILNVVPGK